MPYYLCIDGGGSKTLAIVAHKDGDDIRFAKGTTGPSNLTIGLQTCLSAAGEATRQALSALPGDLRMDVSFPLDRPVFEQIWGAFAGCARQSDFDLLQSPLSRLFCDPGRLRLTNDGRLLVAPFYRAPVGKCITLICGTGSLALSWSKDPNGQVQQQGRSGGWGSLLGDEGSGWSLGKAGIKSVLTFAANHRPLLSWHHAILDKFEIEHPDKLIMAATQLDQSMSHFDADSARKKRIADCSIDVVSAAGQGDSEAVRLVSAVAGQVVDTLRPLIGETEDLKDTMLVVGGGLGLVNPFWAEVEKKMDSEGWRWYKIVRVSDPAMEGMKALLRDA